MRPGPIVLLANGNLNGRVIRLVADDLHRQQQRRVRLISSITLNPVNRWPEERPNPHVVEPEIATLAEAERVVREASVFVLPPFWDRSACRLVGAARRAGTPVVYVVADVGYGVRKLDAADDWEMPDRVCVADPITRRLVVENGVPPSIIRDVGSPYFDAVLAEEPLRPPPGHTLRVGLLANPNGMRERLSDRNEVSPEGVLPGLLAALEALAVPDHHVTIRLHPRQKPELADETFSRCDRTSIDPFPSTSTLAEFLTAHHLVVGSYSMGLMVARMLGRPAVSFQPPMADDGLRREIFAAWDVPVATDQRELTALIAEHLQRAHWPVTLERVLYHPGKSLDAIRKVIDEVTSNVSLAGAVPA
jgi:hypothetical protein